MESNAFFELALDPSERSLDILETLSNLDSDGLVLVSHRRPYIGQTRLGFVQALGDCQMRFVADRGCDVFFSDNDIPPLTFVRSQQGDDVDR